MINGAEIPETCKIKLSKITHHFDRISQSTVSGTDMLIRHGLHMNVKRKEAMKIKRSNI
jgi:hypothetical protein